MSKYQPDTDDVRDQYALDFDGLPYWSTNMNYAEFDRWLAAHDAEVFKRGQQTANYHHECCEAVDDARDLLFRRGMPRWLKIAKLHELLGVVAR
jgi:hypothetical protein